MRRRDVFAAGLAACALGTAEAQEPGRPVTMVHGFGPGGPADGVARLLAGPMGAALGQPVVVDPRPGAGGNIAAAALSRAVPDGSILGLVTGGHAVTAAFGRSGNYEPVEGFEPIAQVVRYAFVLAVRADNPVGDVKGMLRAAGEASGAWQFGSAGSGTTQQLAGELLNAMGNVRITHVPYRGDAASITAVLGGEIPLAITATNVALPLQQSGQLRLLAVTGLQRSARLPQVPTVAEAALPGYDASTWAGLLAPRGTPPAVVARLNAATNQALRDPTLQARLAELVDGDVVGGTPEALRALMVNEIARWRSLIQERGIAPD
ncbi:Tripartite-type tricarboxylate transporter, receptor component TctC [Roseomonas rosea]|uniref:Tripartite-type tricarboxylate transporter, receptor component TctC n=1 Tax=Muricoccus roseus TaxID=198092 RepID=A0A1M6PSR2_9PROT|nr:tripartite tricarboxylate transporter substrate-binding protein [Roseomonas rosea]SHK10999.1 Tripartite-type tricarboxylate transporter, receptor component TctC [Roseomonas rosea]